MKQLLCLLLAACLLLAGCTGTQEKTYQFYYLRTDDTIRYGTADGLVAPISRNISGGNEELNYLLQLYLDGPGTPDYLNPIPRGTYLLSTIWQEEVLVIVLSREFSELDTIHLSLAGACLTATCHGLTGAEKIQVRSGDSVYDFDLESYHLLDASGTQ